MPPKDLQGGTLFTSSRNPFHRIETTMEKAQALIDAKQATLSSHRQLPDDCKLTHRDIWKETVLLPLHARGLKTVYILCPNFIIVTTTLWCRVCWQRAAGSVNFIAECEYEFMSPRFSRRPLFLIYMEFNIVGLQHELEEYASSIFKEMTGAFKWDIVLLEMEKLAQSTKRAKLTVQS